MHWKTKQKILSTTKVYLTLPDLSIKKCKEVRLQLPSNEYILLELHQPIPYKPLYNSLVGGFNQDSESDDGIVHYGKTLCPRINYAIRRIKIMKKNIA